MGALKIWDQVLGAWAYVGCDGAAGAAGASGVLDYAVIQYQLANGNSGAAASSGAWTTYPLNTIVTNVGSHASLSTNVVTLDAGTYEMDGDAVFWRTGRSKLRLRNTTGAATLVVGASGCTAGADNTSVVVPIKGSFTVAAAQNLELQYWCESAGAGEDLGPKATSGEVEVYGNLVLRKRG